MLNDSQLEEGAAILWRAFQQKRQEPPLSASFPQMDIADAYRIQERFVAARLSEGQKVRGYKVGLTSKAMQELAGTDEPDYGVLIDSFMIENGATLLANAFIRPAVEIEIAFVMKKELRGPNVTFADVVDATDYVRPAIEIVDFRLEFKNRRDGILDTVADLASCGAVVLGGNSAKLADIDFETLSGRLLKNDAMEEEGNASEVLGNPINAIAWLANKLHEINNTTFRPGEVILSGSFIKIVRARPGDHFSADFGQGLGSVEFSLAEGVTPE